MSLINAAGNNSSNYEHSCTYYWKEKKVLELSGIKWGVEICQSRATRDDDNFDYQTKLNGELKSVNQGAPRGGGNKKLVQKKGGAK